MAKTRSQGQARKTSLLSQSPPDMHNSSNYCKTQRHSRSKLTTEKSTRLNIMCKCPPKTIIILATLSALSALLLAAWSTHKDRKRLGRAGLRRVFANHWWGQGKLSPVLGFGQFGLPPPRPALPACSNMTTTAAPCTPRRDLAKIWATGYLSVGYLNDLRQCQKHQSQDENTTCNSISVSLLPGLSKGTQSS